MTDPRSVLTKLGYLIDNPWSNALDRSVAAGAVLADILMNRNLGVRPITLVGFSLGARVIFYALVELAKHKAYGIIQDVILLGATVTAPTRVWHDVRGVVAGRLINGYARNDWILNYLFRATTGGMNTVAGLRPIEKVPGLENVDVTDKISGHMSYRIYMPVILEQLGFPVTATYFDEPEVWGANNLCGGSLRLNSSIGPRRNVGEGVSQGAGGQETESQESVQLLPQGFERDKSCYPATFDDPET